MYFCPNCSYSFDISKKTNQNENSDIDERKIINKAHDIIKLYEMKEDLSLYKAEFTKDELNKNKKYQKLSDEEKLIINQIFEKSLLSEAIFQCSNCNYAKEIKETVLLYQYNVDSKDDKIKSLSENKFLTKDPLLPRTRDYICKNPSCITHKDETKKEAVFYRDKSTFKLNYICTVCYFGW
jgi:hypothetical protein